MNMKEFCIVLLATLINLSSTLSVPTCECSAERVEKLEQRMRDLERKLMQKSTYIYRGFTEKLNFYAAREFCLERGGDLAHNGMETAAGRKEIFNQTELAHKEYEGESLFWFGAGNRFNHDEWYFVDGTKVPLETFGWRAGEPSNINRISRENCANFFRPGLEKEAEANDGNCDLHFPFICQFSTTIDPAITVYVVRQIRNWHGGRDYCRKQGGSLARFYGYTDYRIEIAREAANVDRSWKLHVEIPLHSYCTQLVDGRIETMDCSTPGYFMCEKRL